LKKRASFRGEEAVRVVVAGGTGFIGEALVAYIAGQKHEVCVLTRRANPPSTNTTSIRYEHWDGVSAGQWTRAVAECDALINLAGENLGEGSWTDERKKRILESRVQTATVLVEALRNVKRKERVLLQASAVGFYGHGDVEVNENGEPGQGFLAEVCQAWEQPARVLLDSDTRVVWMRSGVVLDRDGGVLPLMVMPFRFFVGGVVGTGRQWLSWIHLRDEIRAIAHLLSHQELSGPINITAPFPVTMREFAQTAAKVLKRPALVPVPATIIKMVLGEQGREMVLSGIRTTPAALLRSGFAFAFPKLLDALSQLYGRIRKKR
jgi:uncharacterized protein (TIGR01777 family)